MKNTITKYQYAYKTILHLRHFQSVQFEKILMNHNIINKHKHEMLVNNCFPYSIMPYSDTQLSKIYKTMSYSKHITHICYIPTLTIHLYTNNEWL